MSFNAGMCEHKVSRTCCDRSFVRAHQPSSVVVFGFVLCVWVGWCAHTHQNPSDCASSPAGVPPQLV